MIRSYVLIYGLIGSQDYAAFPKHDNRKDKEPDIKDSWQDYICNWILCEYCVIIRLVYNKPERRA